MSRSRVLPGRPYPLGATWDGHGVNFALFSENATRVELCLFDSPTTRRGVAAHRAARADRHGLARLPARRRARASSTATASTAPTSRRAGHRFNPNKLCSTRTPRRSAATDALGATRCSATASATRTRTCRSTSATAPPFAPLAAVVDRPSPGATIAPPRTPWHETVIYELHVKGFTQLHPDVPEALRGTYAGLATEPAIHHLHDARRDRGRAAAGAPSRLRPPPGRARAAATTGATTRSASSRPTCATPSARDAGDAVREFKTMVRALHAAGIEVILDVVYNHTAEGNHLGPTLSLRGIDNAAYYRLVAGQPALLHGLHRLRQHAQHAASARAAADHGQPALLGAGDARRRLPLRPRQRAGARAARGRPARRLLRHHPPGPGALAGQADRRAVGPRRGRLPGRQLPRAAGPSGTAGTATRVRRFWRGDGGAGVASSPPGSPAAATSTSTSGRRPYASINFVTAHDGFTLHDLVSYNEKHNEANGEDNHDGDNDNLSWNCGVEGPTDDPGDQRAARSARSATSSPRCCSRRACRCSAPATRSAAPSAATTTPTARTTRSAGSTGSSTPTTARSARLHPPR